jgi:hypothetical protein
LWSRGNQRRGQLFQPPPPPPLTIAHQKHLNCARNADRRNHRAQIGARNLCRNAYKCVLPESFANPKTLNPKKPSNQYTSSSKFIFWRKLWWKKEYSVANSLF